MVVMWCCFGIESGCLYRGGVSLDKGIGKFGEIFGLGDREFLVFVGNLWGFWWLRGGIIGMWEIVEMENWWWKNVEVWSSGRWLKREILFGFGWFIGNERNVISSS